MSIVIVNIGLGNTHSVAGALDYLGFDNVKISKNWCDLQEATHLILPGVGAFDSAMQDIKDNSIDRYLHELVIENKVPILGICLGMQILAEVGTEHKKCLGLGFVPGEVTRFESKSIKIPHVGFNNVEINYNSKLYDKYDKCTDFYFTHSYRLRTTDQINLGYCQYGNKFIASFEHGHICGVQFHPELSQAPGLKLLNNFVKNF